tara:strand:- start:847 stop:1164 length:318 start_codon:yes stop_codon:yes gene_type:complete
MKSSFIKEIYGLAETRDGGVYQLSGDELITIKPSSYDSDEHDEGTKFYIYNFIRYFDYNNIVGISGGVRESEANWYVAFENGTGITLNSLNEVKNFLKVYQMIRD